MENRIADLIKQVESKRAKLQTKIDELKIIGEQDINNLQPGSLFFVTPKDQDDFNVYLERKEALVIAMEELAYRICVQEKTMWRVIKSSYPEIENYDCSYCRDGYFKIQKRR